MKWLIKLLFLFGFIILSEYSVSAASQKELLANSSTTIQSELTNAQDLFQNYKLTFSRPGILKKEYRKIRGTNEEDDEDDKNTSLTKKAKVSNLKPFRNNNNILTSLKSSCAVTNSGYYSKNQPSSSFYFCCLNGDKLHAIFQVYII